MILLHMLCVLKKLKILHTTYKISRFIKDNNIINNLEIKTDNINFLTKKPDEIWNILQQAGCTFKEIEIQNRTLLDSIFVTTKDNGGAK